ncbi:MAG TPA: hypothetical protein VLJ59_18285 [Mycobacteriales bacterium]|nr:hypothetical protein [Mycobacteriales bacterium]
MTAPPPAGQPPYATAAAVAGVAREVEALRRAVDQVSALPERVEELARLAAGLAEQSAAAAGGASGGGPVSWLGMPTTVTADQAAAVLAELTAWIGTVYLRYSDAARTLPGCWLWHPDVVEELLWLHQAWAAAYHPHDGTVTAAADWHDRMRPGVTRRIRDTTGMCSIENHQPGGEAHQPAPAPPLADAAAAIAAWWTGDRTGMPPEPTTAQVTAAAPARTTRGRR